MTTRQFPCEECGILFYANSEEEQIECPKCHNVIDLVDYFSSRRRRNDS